jgi:hypothetical protein|tara:strand:+ start:872 stop:1336 length:465 start_codon:yes stop_codon:yes gene_type:complete
MAIISAYPVGTPAAGDYLVGSDITTTGAQLNPTKNFVISDVVATGLGYTAYNALVTQTGVLAPVISDLKNNTGATMTWTRTGVGTYRCTASSPVFTATNKVQVFINQGKPGAIGTFIQWERINTTTIGIDTYNIAGAAADTKLDNAPIEIRIYT